MKFIKFILAIIAVELFLLLLNQWFKPVPVSAQSYYNAANVRVIYVDPAVIGDINRAGGIRVRQ